MHPTLPGTPLPPQPATSKTGRRHRATLKLLLIAALVLLLQLPLALVNDLQKERRATRASGGSVAGPWREGANGAEKTNGTARTPGREGTKIAGGTEAGTFEAYRMVERALKHSVLVLALVFAAFFLFETLAELRLHAVHYGLVGAAMCLFYLALLALGEVCEPGAAYVFAALASSVLVVSYSAAILKSGARAVAIATLLASVHGVLYIVLRMENFALLAGTGALFAALAAVMFLTRKIDWHAQDAAVGPGVAT